MYKMIIVVLALAINAFAGKCIEQYEHWIKLIPAQTVMTCKIANAELNKNHVPTAVYVTAYTYHEAKPFKMVTLSDDAGGALMLLSDADNFKSNVNINELECEKNTVKTVYMESEQIVTAFLSKIQCEQEYFEFLNQMP